MSDVGKMGIKSKSIVWALCGVTLGALSGCNFADSGAQPVAGQGCVNEGSSATGLVCRNGSWEVSDQPLDMTPDANTQDGDMIVADMSPDSGGCVGETDEELCQQLGRCATTLSVSDRCNEVRDITCSPTCAQGTCDLDSNTCSTECVPKMCDPSVMCAKMSNGCGAMQVCDFCPDGDVCNPDSGMCECDADAAMAMMCEGKCGMVPNTQPECVVGGSASMVDCQTCNAGSCESGSCVMLEDFAGGTLAQERFGESIAGEGSYLMIGAPGPQATYLGNAYVYKTENQVDWMRVMDVRQDINTGFAYQGYRMGHDVAATGSSLSMVGKLLDTRQAPYDNDVHTFVELDDVWSKGLTLSIDGKTAGQQVAAATNMFAISSPESATRRGAVTLYVISVATQTILKEIRFNGNEDDELMGTSLDVTKTQLIFGSPGGKDNQGVCSVARLIDPPARWSGAEVVTAKDPSGDGRFCEHVALANNRFAASIRNRMAPNAQEPSDAVQLFLSEDSGQTWEYSAEIYDPMSGESAQDGGFGQSMVWSGDFLVIADPLAPLEPHPWEGDQQPILQAGVVYVYLFHPDGGDYELVRTIRSNNPMEYGHFGSAVDVVDFQLFIGAPGESRDGKIKAGNVYSTVLK